MGRKVLAIALVFAAASAAQNIALPGLKSKVEILRDKWGVPHIYAASTHDLFFAQGWIAAKDRLFQIDLWRRTGTGRLAEVLGPKHVQRDRFARLVSYRGDWQAEWKSYSPDAREIAQAFAQGINAYVSSLKGKRPAEFEAAGYDPGLWTAEDVTARIAGLSMVRNATVEITRALDIKRFGLETVRRLLPTEAPSTIEVPRGLDLNQITAEILREYQGATGGVRFEDGSNNWVVDGTMTATGKPLLANDPHRALQVPSLRKTVHLVAPGWNVIGSGEAALPGIALGHNEDVAFGFTIVNIDQQDLYIESLNPANPLEYRLRGQWKPVRVIKESIPVHGVAPVAVELKYTDHGPIIFEDPKRNLAVALKWVGSEPGGAGYLPALALSRAKDWKAFLAAAENYKVPSENLIYADRAGNIGWIAGGRAPLRNGWNGLLPVPGGTGEYEWQGWLPIKDHPQKYNPPEHWIATANANILPPKYPHLLGFDFSPPFRQDRLRELLQGEHKFTIADFARMQYDIVSLPARRFQQVLRRWNPRDARLEAVRQRLLKWDARISADSAEALIYEIWMMILPSKLFGPELGARVSLATTLRELEAAPASPALGESLQLALGQLEKALGPEGPRWTWGTVHQLGFRHPINRPGFHVDPQPQPGDANTVFAASWAATRPFAMNHGASFREILDPADWDRSVITNVPGESGDPASPHYKDLFADWTAGRHHPLPYSRKAVEAATTERINLVPGK